MTRHPFLDRKSETPTVAVAIPNLNEEANIGSVLKIFNMSRYPTIVDIIVVDGGSRDRTKEIVVDWGRSDPRIRLLDNPKKF